MRLLVGVMAMQTLQNSKYQECKYEALRMNHSNFRKTRYTFLLTVSVACISIAAAQAIESPCPHCGCSNGVQMVEVSRTVCKMVTKDEPIKKTVYEKKEIPFCEHCVAPIGHHHVCPQCKACAKTRTVLVKKSIECGKKTVHECVPEVIHEVIAVPCTECGFCARHGHLFHHADKTIPTPVPVKQVQTAESAEPALGTVEVATEPKLMEQSPLVR